MTMMFCVNYTQNNELKRSIIESEELNENTGEPFEFEKSEDDKSSLIYHLIESTLGESFDSIDLEAKCFRYTFQEIEQEKPTYLDTDNKINSKETNTIEVDIERSEIKSKQWWKFW
jgi:hypothetical protein